MTRVLLVEDEHGEFIGNALRLLGYEVVGIADSGPFALDLAGITRPDLVLMDIWLPGELDGVATAQRLHATSDVPVVYVTGHTDPATLERATSGEGLACVTKPFDPEQLRAAIEIALYRQQLDRRLREAEARYRGRFEASAVAMFVTAPDGTIAECNAAFASMLGYATIDEIEGRRIPEHLVDPTEWMPLVARLGVIDRTTANLELRFVHRDGSVAWGLGNAVRVSGREVERIECQILDITERRRAEQATRTTEAVSAVAALARAVAHEILNPLSAVLGRLQLLEKRLRDPEPQAEVTAAMQGAIRIRDVVRRMFDVTQIEYMLPQGKLPALLDLWRSSQTKTPRS